MTANGYHAISENRARPLLHQTTESFDADQNLQLVTFIERRVYVGAEVSFLTA